MQIHVDESPVILPFTIGSSETNDLVLDNAEPLHAIILESDGQMYLLTSGSEDTAGGRTIPGGFLPIRRRGTNIRLAGHLLRVSLPEKGWNSSEGDNEICPVCRLEIVGPCVQCGRCGLKLHDEAFCRSGWDDCFRCDA